MKALFPWLVALAVTSLTGPDARAQNAIVTQQGTDFAHSIAPSSAAQVVNPTGVNATAWSGSTATPTAVPPNLGAFSNPTTSTNTYTSAQSVGLGGLGNQALDDCANFVPTPNSDPLKVQACAATNFLTNHCMSPDTVQTGVLSNLSMSWNTAGNCAGTYGQGVRNFNFQNQITNSDPMFTGTASLKTTAPPQVTPNCSTQTVQITPPQYATETCIVQSNATPQYCSQTLQVTVTPIHGTCTPPNSLYTGQFSGPALGVDWWTVTAGCAPTAGTSSIPFTFNAWGSRGQCANALTANVDMSQPQPQGANPPPVLGQVVPHWLGNCLPMAVIWTGQGCPVCPNGNCSGQTCSATFHLVQWPGIVTTYGCNPGYTQDQNCPGDGQPCTPLPTCSQCTLDQNGNETCNTVPANTGWDWAPGTHFEQPVTFPVPGFIPASAQTSWGDGCTAYEASAGSILPTPVP
jgi:hypothetical protein